jgi:hypothetical protein
MDYRARRKRVCPQLPCGVCSECAGFCTRRQPVQTESLSLYSMCSTKWLFRLGLGGNRPWTGDSEDLAAQVLLYLALKEAVPKHDLYSHPMFSTPRFLPFRPTDWPLASPILNPITYVSFETVAPEMEPFFFGGFVAGNPDCDRVASPEGDSVSVPSNSQRLPAGLMNAVAARLEHRPRLH